MAALVLVILLNPFSGHLQTVDEVVAYSIANHLDTTMEMALRAEEIRDVGQWSSQQLVGYTVRLPNLKNLELDLRGGRKCTLGKVAAAYLFCQSKGKLVSLFVIRQSDVDVPFDRERKYIVEEGATKVTLWGESGMV